MGDEAAAGPGGDHQQHGWSVGDFAWDRRRLVALNVGGKSRHNAYSFSFASWDTRVGGRRESAALRIPALVSANAILALCIATQYEIASRVWGAVSVQLPCFRAFAGGGPSSGGPAAGGGPAAAGASGGAALAAGHDDDPEEQMDEGDERDGAATAGRQSGETCMVRAVDCIDHTSFHFIDGVRGMAGFFAGLLRASPRLSHQVACLGADLQGRCVAHQHVRFSFVSCARKKQ